MFEYMRLVEKWPNCPGGHPYRADHVVIGWEPCLCAAGRTGHRSYWCREDNMVQLVPECRRGRSDSARGMGISGPVGWPD